MNRTFVSFPEGRLGESPQRFSLLANTENWFALEKPAGLAAVRDALAGGGVSLLEALRADAESGKNQLREAGIGEVHAVAYPDPEISGVLLCAKSEETRTRMRNALGANEYVFTYRFLTAARDDPPQEVCDLPLAHPQKSTRMIVSHTTGKKTETRFRRVRQLGRYVLWEAESAYNRRHQILLHAVESGLPVLGDRMYARSGALYLSALKPRYRSKGEEHPLYAYPCLHLAGLRFPDPDSGEARDVEAALPRKLRALFAQVERYG